MAAIFLKIGALMAKTLSKPLASYSKNYASNHPTLRGNLIAFARWKHGMNTRLEQALRPDGAPRLFVGKLSEERALSQGANFFGESIVFTVAGGILVWEYRRQSAKDEIKNAVESARRAQVADDLQTLNLTLAEVKERLEAIETKSKELDAEFEQISGLITSTLLKSLEK